MNDTKLLTLDNGLKIVIYENKKQPINVAKFITKIGGLTDKLSDGTKIIPGTAHLLEHFICENSKNGIIVKELLDNNAYHANAKTSNDLTIFYFATINNFENLLEILLEGVYSTVFTKERLDKTKIPIYSEINDEEVNVFAKAVCKTLFKRNINTLGNKEDVERIDYKYLEYVYNNVFVPSNQILVIGTNKSTTKILNLIKKIYKKHKFNNYLMPIMNRENEIYQKELIFKEDSIEETFISFKFNLDDYSSIEKYKLDFYLQFFINIHFFILPTFVKELKEKNIIMEDISIQRYRRNNCFVLELSSYTLDSKKFKEEIIKYVNNVKYSEYNFNLEKESTRTYMAIRKDSIFDYLDCIIDNYCSFDYFHVDELKDVDNLNYKEYVEFIDKLDFNNYSVVYKKEAKL